MLKNIGLVLLVILFIATLLVIGLLLHMAPAYNFSAMP
jgi:hypothetical protein